jgi:hypothetical protein
MLTTRHRLVVVALALAGTVVCAPVVNAGNAPPPFRPPAVLPPDLPAEPKSAKSVTELPIRPPAITDRVLAAPRGRAGPMRPDKRATPSTTPHSTWDEQCRWLPGVDAPDWARAQLHRLYLGPAIAGASPPPGASAGCPGMTYSTIEAFAYVIGTTPAGDLGSLATVSRRFGPALFLAPAGDPVLHLIRTYGDIGSTRRLSVRAGDYYAVRTPAGTAVLVRPSAVRADNPTVPQSYVTLPPAAATVWMNAMRTTGTWLWPLSAGQVNGKQRIKLVPNLRTGRAAQTIFVDPSSGAARQGGRLEWRGRYGSQLSEQELRSYAARAR